MHDNLQLFTIQLRKEESQAYFQVEIRYEKEVVHCAYNYTYGYRISNIIEEENIR